MTKVVHGIVHGKTIEVTEDLGMSDGQAVEVLVVPAGRIETAGGGEPATSGAQEVTGTAVRMEARPASQDGRAIGRFVDGGG